jgi:hypothetical protein
MKYKILVLLTCYAEKDCIKDTIENILKFNKDTAIVINNGIFTDNLSEFSAENVHIVPRNDIYNWDCSFFSLIPLHVDLWDYIIQNDIQAEYVITLSSNQLFIRHDIYDFMKWFDASQFGRRVPDNIFENLHTEDSFSKNYIDDLGKTSFIYQSNHDGMFYKWEVFSNMMKYFEDHRGRYIGWTSEEYLYPAWLVKNIPEQNITKFSTYNYFHLVDYNLYDPNAVWFNSLRGLNVDDVKDCIFKGMYIVKRIDKVYDNEARSFIRSLT